MGKENETLLKQLKKMKRKIFEFIAKYYPSVFLPSAKKGESNLKTGKQIVRELTIAEKRVRLVDQLDYYYELYSNKYSPYRLVRKYIRKHLLLHRQKKHYEDIGKITLLHAGIEQNLKFTLYCDWGIPDKIKTSRAKKKKKLKYVFGKELTETFLLKLKEISCPLKWVTKYEILLEELNTLSEKRNEILKSFYGHNEDNLEIIKINEIAWKNMRQIMKDNNNDFDDFRKKWLKPVNHNEIKSLIVELEALKDKLNKIRSEIWIEKHELYIDIFIKPQIPFCPEDASENPYKYLNFLEEHNAKKV